MKPVLAMLGVIVVVIVYMLAVGYAFYLLVTGPPNEFLKSFGVLFGILLAPLIPFFFIAALERPRYFLLLPLVIAAAALMIGVQYSGSWIVRAATAPDWLEALFSFVYKGLLSGVIISGSLLIGAAIVKGADD